MSDSGDSAFFDNEQQLSQLKNQDKEVKEQMKALGLSHLSEVVDQEIAEASEEFMGDERWAKEAELREWVRTLHPNFNISDAEQIIGKAKKLEEWGVFAYRQLMFIKTTTGTIDRLDLYIERLESVIISMQQSKDETGNLGFFGYIKLAFKSLFRRTNG